MLPRYEFCKENSNHLLEFLRVANVNRNSPFCNPGEYNVLAKLCPLKEEIKVDLREYAEKQNTVIDITMSSDEEDSDKIILDKIGQDFTDDAKKDILDLNISVVDTIDAVKENLKTLKYLSSTVINHLHNSENLEEIFSELSKELCLDEVVHFGATLNTAFISNESIISCYVKYLLLNQGSAEFSKELESISNELACRYPEILMGELMKYLQKLETVSKVFVQFLERLNSEFKTNLLRSCALTWQDFQPIYIEIIQALLGNQLDFHTLTKLIELMSCSADKYSTDKGFGKLLINIIKGSGRNIVSVEQPVRHMVTSHSSIWKSKMQKALEDCLLESSFTQSMTLDNI